MNRLFAVLLMVFAVPAFAADLVTTWTEVTSDDTGAALPTPVEEYRVYDCSDMTIPIASVPGTETSYTEVGAVSATGTYCRAVTAYIAPFEGAERQGTLVVVVPGQPATINVQAIQ